MKVNEIMTRNPVCMAPDATVRDAAGRMREMDVGSFPVCENERLVGVVTDRDIVVRSAAEGHDPNTDRVREVMTPKIVYCFEDEDVDEAAKLMRDHQIRRLPILSQDKMLVGIVALGDLAIDTSPRLSGITLKSVSEPSVPVG